MDAYSNMRSHHTPIPTPPIVRLGASVLVGFSVAILTSRTAIGTAVAFAVAAAVLAILLTLRHPYRAKMKAYAEMHGTDMFPTVQQIVPVFIWWLLAMLAPIASFPWWAALAVWLIGFGFAYQLFPHVDGSRRLAFV